MVHRAATAKQGAAASRQHSKLSILQTHTEQVSKYLGIYPLSFLTAGAIKECTRQHEPQRKCIEASKKFQGVTCDCISPISPELTACESRPISSSTRSVLFLPLLWVRPSRGNVRPAYQKKPSNICLILVRFEVDKSFLTGEVACRDTAVVLKYLLGCAPGPQRIKTNDMVLIAGNLPTNAF